MYLWRWGLHACVCRLNEGFRYLPLSLSNYSFETGSLPEPGAHAFSPGSPNNPPLCSLLEAGVTGMCKMPGLFHGRVISPAPILIFLNKEHLIITLLVLRLRTYQGHSSRTHCKFQHHPHPTQGGSAFVHCAFVPSHRNLGSMSPVAASQAVLVKTIKLPASWRLLPTHFPTLILLSSGISS